MGGPGGIANSSVLDRVKMFLPLIEKANNDLADTVSKQGQQSVAIDNDMLASSSDEDADAGEDSDDDESIDDQDNDKDVGAAKGLTLGSETSMGAKTSTKKKKNGMIQIDFALGDFTDTPLANLEQAKEDEVNAVAEALATKDLRARAAVAAVGAGNPTETEAIAVDRASDDDDDDNSDDDECILKTKHAVLQRLVHSETSSGGHATKSGAGIVVIASVETN